jgi:uncharacterized membrane protein
MIRKTFLIVVCGLLLVLTLPASAQTREVFWERWDVDIFNVDTADNSFRVRESYDVRFDGTFRFGTAVIPDDRLTSITDVVVYQDGEMLSASCNQTRATYCVQQVQEGYSIVYYFLQTITNGSSSFTVEYTVNGALRVYEGGDQLWWVAVPEDKFGFSVGSSTITVELPAEYAPRPGVDPVVTYGAAADVRVDNSLIVATATELIGPDETFEIRVQYPHNPAAVAPPWQEDFDRQRDFEENIKPLVDIGLIAVSLLVGIAGPLLVYSLWYNRGRDPQIGPVPEYLSEPPSDLPPAVVGTLVDERADTRDVLSTLIDLGRRGYLVIQEDKKEGLFGLGGSSEFTFKRTDKPLNDLRGFERKIMDRVFSGRLTRKMDSLKNKFYQYMSSLKDDLYGELVEAGLVDAKPSTTRAQWSGFGAVILFIAAFAGFIALGALETVTWTLICLPIAIAFTGVAMVVVGNFMPKKTRAGAEEAAKWDAFREYMRNLDKYDNVEAKAEIFDRYLPYAIAFNMDSTWVRRFAKVSSTPPPIWYYPTYRGGHYSGGYRAGTPLGDALPTAGDVAPGEIARAGGSGGFSLETMAGDISGGLESMASGISEMLESASRTLTSTPSSSGSGSWSGGGSSFSGGGSFGGGGSGGGSRGFG